jgi:hypothetical protein
MIGMPESPPRARAATGQAPVAPEKRSLARQKIVKKDENR